jgi:hypothetical protein
MSNQLATAASPQRTSALALMGSRLNCDPAKLHQTLKDTVFKGASDSELLALVVVANEYGLNPLTKELYAFPAKGGGIVPVVSVDGWVRMVNDHPQMDGIEFETHKDAAGKLEAITCSIWRRDRNRPIRVTEHLSECKRGTEPWKMENRMLRHKALMQCARYAFGFSGVTDDDEAADQSERQATGRVIEPEVNPFAERKAIGIPAPADDAPPFSTDDAAPEPQAEAPTGNVIVGYFEKFTNKIEIEVEPGEKGDTIKSIAKVEGGEA